MIPMKKIVILVLLSLVLFIGGGTLVYNYYGFLFAKHVIGKIEKVERVNPPQAIITGSANPIPAAQLFSFAVAIRDERGEIHTSSAEDRQWAVAQVGQCVEAKYFPYAPWQLDKAGTYYGARLLRLYDCGSAASHPDAAPSSP